LRDSDKEKFLEDLNGREEERVKAENASVVELKWHRLTISKENIWKTCKKMLKILFDMGDTREEQYVNERVESSYQVTRIMSMTTPGVSRGKVYLYFPLC
jgi:hypothetical protein